MEQQLRPTNEIVKLVLNSTSSLIPNPIQVEVQMPVHLQKVYMYEAETQTNANEISDILSKEARLTGSNKYGLLSLDEYQIIRTGEEHCLKKYFSDDDDDVSLSDEEEKQLEEMNFDEGGEVDRTEKKISSVLIENLNNNAATAATSTILHTSHSDLSSTLLLDDTTHLSATLAQSTSSRISHSRYLQTFKEDDQLTVNHDEEILSNEKNISSIRWFVRQAINSCRQNLTIVDQLLETLPSSSSSYEHILQRKIRRTNCMLNIPNTIKGLKYYPSTSVQTE